MYIVYEKKPNNHKLKQISIPLSTEKDAKGFIDTMKLGMNYRTIHPDYELLYCEVKNPNILCEFTGVTPTSLQEDGCNCILPVYMPSEPSHTVLLSMDDLGSHKTRDLLSSLLDKPIKLIVEDMS